MPEIEKIFPLLMIIGIPKETRLSTLGKTGRIALCLKYRECSDGKEKCMNVFKGSQGGKTEF